ncbi:MAG: hypothetical protein AAB358_01595 [Patescibacteria group bacterium]
MSLPLNFFKFFEPARFFEARPAIAMSTVYFLIAAFGLVIVVGFIIKIFQKAKKREHFFDKLLKMYFSCLVAMGLIGLVLVWFRYERAIVLSGRPMLLLWLVGLFTWLAYILKYQFKVVPKALQEAEKKKIFNQYLPKKR